MANSKLSDKYSFTKPNDVRALNLMNRAATSVFNSVSDLCIAYGVSDEYSFVFHRSTSLFERREAKLVSTVVSSFTAAYIYHWGEFMSDDDVRDGKDKGLVDGWLPTFDGRAVCYPDVRNLRDYLSWRQVDCHINNLYNTTFWAMVQHGKMSATEAEEELKGSLAADKNEILFSRFGINYNNELDIFRKGSVVFKEYALEEVTKDTDDGNNSESMSVAPSEVTATVSRTNAGRVTSSQEENLSKTQQEKLKRARQKAKVVVKHIDIIKDDFWQKRPWILSGKPGQPVVNQ